MGTDGVGRVDGFTEGALVGCAAAGREAPLALVGVRVAAGASVQALSINIEANRLYPTRAIGVSLI
jgi:hypothetical protein